MQKRQYVKNIILLKKVIDCLNLKNAMSIKINKNKVGNTLIIDAYHTYVAYFASKDHK